MLSIFLASAFDSAIAPIQSKAFCLYMGTYIGKECDLHCPPCFMASLGCGAWRTTFGSSHENPKLSHFAGISSRAGGPVFCLQP
jgi:hypothetical protein